MSMTKRTLWKLFAILSAVATLPRQSRAQIYFQITHAPTIDTNEYVFSALSGAGRWYTAAARKTYSTSLGLSFVFLRSNDGGLTWTEEDAGLPNNNRAYHDEFNKLQQIDSLNVIAASKYGFILRTFDGGATWQKQMAGDSLYSVSDVDFSDSLNGILTKGGYVHQVWTTSDGGRNWLPAPFAGLAYQCHISGPGHYQLFGYGNGPLYTTDDNWTTIDTAYVSDSLMNPKKVLQFCFFGTGGLMFAGGTNWTSTGPLSLLARTSDGGKTWKDTTIPYFNEIQYMSDPNRDTIVACGSSTNNVLLSTDNGLTWQIDSCIVGDSAELGFSCGINLTSDNRVVAAFDDVPLIGSGYLVMGTFPEAGLDHNVTHESELNIFPDPATKMIIITSSNPGKRITILNTLGQKVLQGTVSRNTPIIFNVASLPAGIYYVTDGSLQAKFVKQ